MRDEPEILFDRKGVAGIVTLNRPGALNALTHNMVRLLAAKLAEWKNDAAVTRVGIGFFPDVGATWFLPRLKGEIGTYCALTGERLKTMDGVAAGVASHHVRSARLAELTEALCGDVSVDAILAAFAEPPADGEVMRRRPAIDRLFAGASIENILAALEREAK